MLTQFSWMQLFLPFSEHNIYVYSKASQYPQVTINMETTLRIRPTACTKCEHLDKTLFCVFFYIEDAPFHLKLMQKS